MDLRDLDCFVAIAETGSVTAASARLNRVQSGVSVRLKNLETSLGTPLFERHGKRLTLNHAGERFLGAARELLAQAEQAKQLLQDPQPGGKLRIASMECTAATHLPKVLSLYHRRHPQVQLELITLPSWTATKAVENGEIDAAFVSSDANNDALASQQAFSENLVIVSSAEQPTISHPRDIDDQALLVFPNGCAYRARLEQWALQSPRPLRRIELSSYHALLGCASAGTGIGLVPESLLKIFPDRKLLKTHPLTKKRAIDNTILVWNPKKVSANLHALQSIIGNAPKTR